MSEFKIDPATFIAGDERVLALQSLKKYFTDYSGRKFEEYLDARFPNEFTASDLLAVSMLSVNIPAHASIWILEQGRAQIGNLLSLIPSDATVTANDQMLLTHESPLALWRLLRDRKGLGRTKTSKLLAAKRPHLFPVYDQHVAAALLHSPDDDWWEPWQQRFSGQEGADLESACHALLSEADLPSSISPLRVLDVVIWMRVHGDRSLAHLPRFWGEQSATSR